ncbi:hypothetical protein [Dysgonomonas sp. 511]|uniref:hypothetical protein n=1 Tax=Dysgonomonas sp. 511 TaxID=2302930 RepID=UPI0013D10813|nr:hypothetical protein [Dysgonomonas sp. 511]NDV79916.1 hypothetical protein [Dysgonomonas sp. 511]
MNFYKVDYIRLVRLLLPTMLRRARLKAFIGAMVVPLTRLHSTFLTFRREILYRITRNGQVCHLTAMLNDNFDYTPRRIYITDADREDWGRMLWREHLDRPILLRHDEYFMLQQERFIGADAIDFVVNVPASLNLSADDMARMDSLLRYYKLASKRYIIRLSY